MEHITAGVKAGIVYGIIILLVVPFTLSDRESIFSFSAVFWLFHFVPGMLAVHFGKKTIKNTKDVIISVITAGITSSLFYMVFIIVFLQFLLIESVPSDELFLYEELLALMIFLNFVLGLSITVVYSLFAGMIYALYKGTPVKGRKLKHRLRCPQCGRHIEKSWLFCPYCRYNLEEDTRIYDIHF